MSLYPSDRHQDIQNAIKQLKTRSRSHCWLNRWLTRTLAPLVTVLQKITVSEELTLLTPVILLILLGSVVLSAEERREQKHYQAWQVINSAIGQEAEGGRKTAIEELARDGASLSGLDIHDARIHFLQLPGHCAIALLQLPVPGLLCDASFLSFLVRTQGTDLVEANLQAADLWRANFKAANLWRANLQDAGLGEANLQRANLWSANLQQAYVGEANLRGANLTGSNLRNALLHGTNLQESNLWNANLQGAELWGANLQEAILLGTELTDAKGLDSAFQNGEPYLCGTQLPAAIERSAYRDCEKLPEVLANRYPENFKTVEDAQQFVTTVLEQAQASQ